MFVAYQDASALVKRYVPELGSDVVQHLFERIPLDRMVLLSVGMAEVISILIRKHNGKRVSAHVFRQAIVDYQTEIGIGSPVRIVDVDGAIAVRAYGFIQKYSVNSTDAILLRSALDLAAPLRDAGDDLLLISCDQRLLKAARAEGLTGFDPEAQSAADLDALLGP